MDKKAFQEYLNKLDIQINEQQFEQFDKYYEILVEWNSFMNLTGITEYEEVQIKHFADSLAIQYAINACRQKNLITEMEFLPETMKIIDVGTGAGFPGIPLKIAFPAAEVLLLDSLNKRVKFLNEVIDQLGLQGIETVHARAEEGARNGAYREQFTCAVSRAVANLATLSEYCLPFVAVGGYFVAYKSGVIEEELQEATSAIEKLGGTIVDVEHITLPDTDIERSFIFIKKVKNTPKKYPRKAGLPGKEPLK